MIFRRALNLFVAMLFLAIGFLVWGPKAQAFDKNLIMDDIVFNDYNYMNAAQIDNWLNVNWPNSCISTNRGFQAPELTGYTPSGGFTYGGPVSAGTIIAKASQIYELHPGVILATLQKEESLVSGDAGCSTFRYVSAMGYGCPDGGASYDYSGFELYRLNGNPVTSVSGTCVNKASRAGFSRQVIVATWQLKFDQQRSEGNINWNIQKPGWDNSDDPQSCYTNRMTQGYYQTCPSAPAATFDGLYSIDGEVVHMDTGPTAAFYNYTPHFNGNQNFVTYFTAWFGGTVSTAYYSCHNASNVAGAGTGEHVIANSLGGRKDNLTLTIPNNTGSRCIEAHTWANNNYQVWIQKTATNSPAMSPADVKLLTADGNGDGKDELYKVDYCGASGMVEVHGWLASNQQWASHIATNRPCISSADAEVIAADVNGDGRDETYLIEYRNNGSGRVEVHGWNGDLQQWLVHTATNYGQVDPASAQVIGADLDGDGKDGLLLINYWGNSGRIEVNGWSDNFQQWVSHIATVSPGVLHVDGSNNPVIDVISADTNGDGKDELYKIDYKDTGSGMLEVHGWRADLQGWVSHTATNEGKY